MSLSHLVHRIATDATFADQLQQNPAAAMHEQQLDSSLVEAMAAIARGTWNWQALCALAGGDHIQGYWDAAPNNRRCGSILPTQMLDETAFFKAIRGVIAPGSALATTQSEPVSLLDLPLLCAQTLGASPEAATVVTNAWGSLYTALHLLDNIEDNDKPDRIWAQWGTGPTLNITTGLLATTGLTLDLLEDLGVSRPVARAIHRDFNQTILEMCNGQHDDLTVATPTLDQCWHIARAKSGAFFELACRAAARVANQDASTVDLFGAFGQHLGMLIQITDDISGLWSWERADSDLRVSDRWTLPVAYTMSVLEPVERERLQKALAGTSDRVVEAEAREIIVASGAVLYLTAHAQSHYQAALRILQEITIAAPATMELYSLLQQVAPSTVNREAGPMVSPRLHTSTKSLLAGLNLPRVFTPLRMVATA